eukprot:scaffold126799_cov69-Phaeocystis_antarctica.AAC.1
MPSGRIPRCRAQSTGCSAHVAGCRLQAAGGGSGPPHLLGRDPLGYTYFDYTYLLTCSAETHWALSALSSLRSTLSPAARLRATAAAAAAGPAAAGIAAAAFARASAFASTNLRSLARLVSIAKESIKSKYGLDQAAQLGAHDVRALCTCVIACVRARVLALAVPLALAAPTCRSSHHAVPLASSAAVRLPLLPLAGAVALHTPCIWGCKRGAVA